MSTIINLISIILFIVLLLIFGFLLFFPKADFSFPAQVKKNYCSSDSKLAEVCIEVYQPVCGFFEDNSFKTFSNSCLACKDKNIQYWTEGECKIKS